MRFSLLLAPVLFTCLSTTSCTPSQSGTPQPVVPAPATETTALPAAPLHRQINGYFPSWADSAQNLPYTELDQIYYSFLIPMPTGELEPIIKPEMLRQLVTLGHAAGTKINIAVGGAKARVAPAFTAFAADPALRSAFIKNLLAFIDEYHLDGADIDWEYPVAGVSDEHCALLMYELSAAFKPRGKLLSIAVPGRDFKPNYPSSIFAAIDYLNVMSYDQGGRADHSTIAYARLGLDYWTGRGCPPEKMILGVPFYGRSTTAEPVIYRNLRARGADADSDTFTDADGHTFGYNGRETLRAKAELTIERGLAGMMIWNLDHDTRDSDDSLLSAMREKISRQP
jgi:chitinase